MKKKNCFFFFVNSALCYATMVDKSTTLFTRFNRMVQGSQTPQCIDTGDTLEADLGSSLSPACVVVHSYVYNLT